MGTNGKRLAALGVVVLAGLLWWLLADHQRSAPDSIEDPKNVEDARPGLTGTAMGATARDDVRPDQPAEEKPAKVAPPKPRLHPAQEAALRVKALREAGYDQKVGIGTAGGVVLIDGKPVDEGEALLWRVTGHIGTARAIPVGKEPDARVLLSRDGRFRFDNLEPGQYLVGTVLEDGTVRLLWNRLDVSKERDEELVMLGTGVVEGLVYDKTGAFAEGWRARVSSNAGSSTVIAEVAVAADGTFRIAQLTAGKYWVSVDNLASDDPNASVSRQLVVEDGKVSSIQFGSREPVRLRGTARFQDGGAVRGPGRIIAYRPDQSMAIISYDENGAYDHQIEAGSWSFRFDFSHRHRTVLVPGLEITKDNAARDLKLPCTRIQGQVLHGADVTPQYVRIWPADGKWQDGDAVRVDAEGRWYMPGVKPGRWNLRAETRTKTDAEAVVIEIRADDGLREIDLRL